MTKKTQNPQQSDENGAGANQAVSSTETATATATASTGDSDAPRKLPMICPECDAEWAEMEKPSVAMQDDYYVRCPNPECGGEFGELHPQKAPAAISAAADESIESETAELTGMVSKSILDANEWEITVIREDGEDVTGKASGPINPGEYARWNPVKNIWEPVKPADTKPIGEQKAALQEWHDDVCEVASEVETLAKEVEEIEDRLAEVKDELKAARQNYDNAVNELRDTIKGTNQPRLPFGAEPEDGAPEPEEGTVDSEPETDMTGDNDPENRAPESEGTPLKLADDPDADATAKWRDTPVKELAAVQDNDGSLLAPKAYVAQLETQGVTTMGKAADVMVEPGGFTNVKGIGQKKADILDEAMVAWPATKYAEELIGEEAARLMEMATVEIYNSTVTDE